ncbi:unnamed protein product [Ilex paraguariensis]|uniref:IBH1-like N-terminal domain-containing protein n=1 Tax=Ilex paraguariensis TaxID=185542 RepID=A0ABC8R4B0_9AQUA
MASTVISNPITNSDRLSRRKKKKSSQISRDQTQSPNNTSTTIQWKSEVQQQVYSSKLLKALREVRITSTPSAPRRGRAVREAADRVLAATAKGRTRWSRAILTNRLKFKFMKNKRQRVTATGDNRSPKKPRVSILRLKTKNLPAVQRKARVLGRLVPGCRKQPLPVVLEEATDYIAALEMQVKAMSALAELFSGSSFGAGSSFSPEPLNQLGSSRPSPS